MGLIEKQQYNAYFKFVGEKLLKWQELKPNNKEISNLLEAIEFIGLHNNQLEAENRQLEAELESLKQSVRDSINNLNKQTYKQLKN